MMFGMGDKGTTNLITKCLEAVNKRIDTVPDPSQVTGCVTNEQGREGAGLCRSGTAAPAA
jgi:hypothetical protein